MKKICAFLFLAATLTTAAQAQTTKTKKCSWGLKLGLNGSNIRMENADNSDWKTGLVTGIFVKVKTSDKFSIQPEFLYSSMGGRNLNGGTDNSLRLNYFSVPVLAQYKLNEKLSVFAGPQVDVMITAKTKNSSGSFAKVADNYRENSFNATGGLAFWPLKCFGLSARYIYGFNNISETAVNEMKNQGVQLTAALKLGKK